MQKNDFASRLTSSPISPENTRLEESSPVVSPSLASLSRRRLLSLLGSTVAASALAPVLTGTSLAQGVMRKPLLGQTSVALCDLDLSLMDQTWNIPQRNKAVTKKTLRVGGRTMVHGVGTHADSVFNVRLAGGTQRFKALVGVDDNTDANGTVRFSVLGDGKELWKSEVLKKGDSAVPVNLDIQGIDWLTLRVDDGGDGIGGDHADWGEATFEGVSTIPVAVARLPREKEIFLPGRAWLDTNGHTIQAHGGGILQHGGKWWWYGEDRSKGYIAIGVSAYSSSDLSNWKHEGVVLPRASYDAKHGDQTLCERPKVVYNPATQKFVLWFHYDRSGYGDSRAGVAVADRPEGPFQYVGEHRPIETSTYRDMNVFVDDDGHAYAFYAGEDNWTMHVIRLNREWTGPEMPMEEGKTWSRILVRKMREAPAPFKYAGKYYLITSGCTGWAANAADLAVADTPLGPWTSLGNPCVGPSDNMTFESQSTFVLPMPGAPAGHFIFMSDRWKPQDLANSRYLWIPFKMSADPRQTKIEWRPSWTLESARRI